MKKVIHVCMVIKDIELRKELFYEVIIQAIKISNNFHFIDHGSTDNTKNIIYTLKDLFPHILINYTFDSESKNMDIARALYIEKLQASHFMIGDWIYVLDSDEVISNELIESIQRDDESKDVYYININTYFLGKVIDKNHYQPRLFSMQSVEMNTGEIFHKKFKNISQRSKRLSGPMCHYSYINAASLFKKNIYYAQGDAQKIFEDNPQISDAYIIFKNLFSGFQLCTYTLIKHRNFMHIPGILYSLNWFVYKLFVAIFYIEKKHTGIKN